MTKGADNFAEEASKNASEEDEDLICDAVEPQPEVKGFKGCLQSCCPLVSNAINDLRKVKVAEAVSKKANSLSMAVTSAGEAVGVSASPHVGQGTHGGTHGENSELDTVIERLEDIRKPRLDTYSYRYAIKSAKIMLSCFFDDALQIFTS